MSYLLAPTMPAQAQPGDRSELLFGVGPVADSALVSELVQQAPVNMLTTWFNGTSDLSWHRLWRSSLIPANYDAGYAQHLIIFDETSGSGTRDTVHGPACGLSWPISAQFRQDMEELADLWVGDGPLYVTMFSEFQTYPCQRNQWDGAENYYAALKDNFGAGAATFRRVAEERDSEVSVSFGPWGGWQHQWDEPSVGAGRSLFGHFDDAMRQSDFQSFQVMGNEPGRNADTTLAMLRSLSPYGPVMLAHYKPDNRSGACKGRVSPRDGMAATSPKNPCGATRPHRWSHGRWTDSQDRPPVTLFRDRWAPGRAPVRAFLHAGATFSSGGRNERLPGGDPSPSPLTTGPVRPGRSST